MTKSLALIRWEALLCLRPDSNPKLADLERSYARLKHFSKEHYLLALLQANMANMEEEDMENKAGHFAAAMEHYLDVVSDWFRKWTELQEKRKNEKEEKHLKEKKGEIEVVDIAQDEESEDNESEVPPDEVEEEGSQSANKRHDSRSDSRDATQPNDWRRFHYQSDEHRARFTWHSGKRGTPKRDFGFRKEWDHVRSRHFYTSRRPEPQSEAPPPPSFGFEKIWDPTRFRYTWCRPNRPQFGFVKWWDPIRLRYIWRSDSKDAPNFDRWEWDSFSKSRDHFEFKQKHRSQSHAKEEGFAGSAEWRKDTENSDSESVDENQSAGKQDPKDSKSENRDEEKSDDDVAAAPPEDPFFTWEKSTRKSFKRFLRLFWTWSVEFSPHTVRSIWTLLFEKTQSLDKVFFSVMCGFFTDIAVDKGLRRFKTACEEGRFHTLSKLLMPLDEFVNHCAESKSQLGPAFDKLTLEVKYAKAIVAAFDSFDEVTKIMSAQELSNTKRIPKGEVNPILRALGELESAKKVVKWYCPELSTCIAVQLSRCHFFLGHFSAARSYFDHATLLLRAIPSEATKETLSSLVKFKKLESRLSSCDQKDAMKEKTAAENDVNDEDQMEKYKRLTNEYKQGFSSFVRFVFKHFPPVHVPKFALPLVERFPKKLLVQLVSWYHPDKIDSGKYGKSYQRDCEEIAKFLTITLTENKDK